MTTLATNSDASAGALFHSVVQSTGLNLTNLTEIGALQLAVAQLYTDEPPGSVSAADVASGTFGANIPDVGAYGFPGVLNLLGATVNLSTAGAAFAFTGTTVAAVADTASGAITFNANIGRGTGAVGGFVFAVPVTTSTGTTAQTLTNALVITATTSTRVFTNGTDALVTGIAGNGLIATASNSIGLAGSGGVIAAVRVNGSFASPTIIVSANQLGSLNFAGVMTATTRYAGASVSAIATENWVASTSGGTQLLFKVTPNTTATLVTALTLDQDKSATFAANVNTATYFGSVTALATPSALAATGLYAFASTVSGAVLMGFGTTNDVALMNRAGTPVIGITANSTAVTLAGNLKVTTGFACNGIATPQTAAASGGALATYGAGINGFDTEPHAAALYAMVVAIRGALVANGIMS